MTLNQYIETINKRYILGNATEHTFRGDLQTLLESLVIDIRATNEPKRQSCGAPDYIITRGEIPVGFIEAKDIGDKDLEGKKKTGNQEQFERYKSALSNLIITDYIDFHFYRDGVLVNKISIGQIDNKTIIPVPENFNRFTELVKNFTQTISQTIKSPTRLAEMMAGKARLMAEIIENALNEDDQNEVTSNLKRQMLTFQKMLIHDLDNKSYSDLYSQTIAYGMFAARYHDPSLPTFSREEALTLIPRSNPFLGHLFIGLTGNQLDQRLVWIVDELVNVFLASDVASIMKNFGKSTKQEDPVVHFYETFLGAYNPALRKARGVWYTPAPVVNFIVRAVDDILKTEFDLPEGLADTSKKKIKVNYQGKIIEKEVHRVQVLDPATGTGTFLAETIKHIHKKYEGIQGMWSSYVENHLIPRMNGFELLMASYTMAHLKLDMLLTDTGYVPTKDQRLRVFLTNSLEEPHADSGNLFGTLLSDEADQADHVKRDTPVMCVIGNPPYNRNSNNSNKHINNLLSDYKKGLNERNLVPLDDDYIKFLRYGQYLIDKTGTGTLAYISANSFLDGVTHRQMRNNLLESFDKVFILNLHGNAKKNEVCPDGSPDQNVFDIMTGVSVNIFVKNGLKKKSELGKLFYFDLFGKRELKYEFLLSNDFDKLDWKEININKNEPWQISTSGSKKFESYLCVTDIFRNSSPCVRTHNDKELIDFIPFKTEFNKKYLFKAFDFRYVDFDLSKIGRSRIKIMKEFLNYKNIGIIFQRGSSSNSPNTPFLTNIISDQGAIKPGTTSTSTVAPLYLYPDNKGQQTIEQTVERTPNLNAEIVNQIAEKVELTFTNEKETTNDTFAPIDILDYIYAVLHSPTYREKYKEFLKIDFPRIPYPKDQDTFWKLVKLGGEIRQIHLLESPVVDKPISKYPETGTNIVGKPKYENGNVMINETQYFEDVPEVAWNFYIGGYQPAQKWLKDRKDRELQVDDIRHYMKIIVALTETDRLMKEIDKIEIE